MIKCGDCGAILIAKRRKWNGAEYIEYTCNSHHRYGKEYCTPHRIHESQLNEIVRNELLKLKENIIAESEKYDRIIKEWLKKKPVYEQQIKQYGDRITVLKNQIEELIIERISDRPHAQLYNEMIEKREREIAELKDKIEQSKRLDEVSKQKKEKLRTTAELLDDVLSQERISDANLRLIIEKVEVFQEVDKGVDVKIVFNGDFDVA